MKLREIKQAIGAMPPKELVKLDTWLHTLLEDQKSKKRVRGPIKQHEVLQAHRTSHNTYRLERVRCGKEVCKCRKGSLHGPYWYAYWIENGKTKSQYIGKKLPKGEQLRRTKSDAPLKT
jgi:hypothetical protein